MEARRNNRGAPTPPRHNQFSAIAFTAAYYPEAGVGLLPPLSSKPYAFSKPAQSAATEPTIGGTMRLVVDTGASRHMTPSKGALTSLRPPPEGLTITFGNGTTATPAAEGDIYMELAPGHLAVITDVLYLPAAAASLLSVSYAAKKGLNFSFDAGKWRASSLRDAMEAAFTAEEVASLARRTAQRKAVFGPLAPWLLKQACAQLAPLAAAEFNAWQRIGRLPRGDAHSAIALVAKTSSPTQPSDLRGIAVGALLAKLFAAGLERRVTAHTEAAGLHAEGQFGFRRQRSTEQAALALRTVIECHRQQRQCGGSSTRTNGLQQQLRILEQYCAERGLTVNVVKTKVMLLSGAADEQTAMQRLPWAAQLQSALAEAGIAADLQQRQPLQPEAVQEAALQHYLQHLQTAVQRRGASRLQHYFDCVRPECLEVAGYVFILNGGAISWASRLQPTVAASTTESEYIAAATAIKEGLWLRKLFQDLGLNLDTISIYADSQTALKLLKNPIVSNRSKYIDVIHHFARERVARNEVTFEYISTDTMVADSITKAVPTNKFNFCRTGMGLS
ncbi:reverse poly isoform B [Micractinium conductrix]|uniref:Reverse poly isoform B n=1 Tax=Micractinium conductrix TaxID=554055 RepID=A0A2P6VFT2_9CHLO|nr:reverse poly isoform B [Micractinium conductrix]|eukprot:PSC72954.1 reverse poly isoform B [Micractinium conductrix]